MLHFGVDFGLFCIKHCVALALHHHHQNHEIVSVNAKWTWSKWILMSVSKQNIWHKKRANTIQKRFLYRPSTMRNICMKMSSRIETYHAHASSPHHPLIIIVIIMTITAPTDQYLNITRCLFIHLFVCWPIPLFLLPIKTK